MSDPTPQASYTSEVSSYPQVFLAVPARYRRWWLHISLLLLTFATTLIVGARLEYNFVNNLPAFDSDTFVFPLFHLGWILEHPARVILGLPFSVTLMGILLSHELGHFLVAEKNGVYATLPYFIPAPTFIGTFGAVIRIKSPIRSRKVLFDIGIAGPIAGFLVGVPALFWGLALSKPMTPLATNSVVEFGYPLIFRVVHYLLAPFTPHAAPLSTLYLHPIALAAWVGMFATALNLLPGGQLDGGHITYAVSPRAHKWVTRAAIVVLLVMGKFWLGWILWALILGITGLRHPNVPPWPDVGSARRWLSLLGVLMLGLTIVLAPVTVSGS